MLACDIFWDMYHAIHQKIIVSTLHIQGYRTLAKVENLILFRKHRRHSSSTSCNVNRNKKNNKNNEEYKGAHDSKNKLKSNYRDGSYGA